MSASNRNKRSRKSGPEKAAQFLLVMGEAGAAGVLRHLTSDEVQKIGVEMARMSEISTEEVNQVLAGFLEDYESDDSIKVVADVYTRAVLKQALGADEAEKAIGKIMMGGNTRGLDSLKWMEPQLVAGIIQHEHPQIQAIIISHLGPELSGEVLSFMPESAVVELMIRMSEIESVDPEALQELNDSLVKQMEGVVRKQSPSIGGIKKVADILNTLEKTVEDNLIGKIKDVREDLSIQIQDLMYTFDDLISIPDRDFQSLLREVSSDKLALALKGADDAIQAKVLKNMSQRAAEIFKDDMEDMGPVKISDVELAQKEILGVTRKMAEAGDIVLRVDVASMIT